MRGFHTVQTRSSFRRPEVNRQCCIFANDRILTLIRLLQLQRLTDSLNVAPTSDVRPEDRPRLASKLQEARPLAVFQSLCLQLLYRRSEQELRYQLKEGHLAPAWRNHLVRTLECFSVHQTNNRNISAC